MMIGLPNNMVSFGSTHEFLKAVTKKIISIICEVCLKYDTQGKRRKFSMLWNGRADRWDVNIRLHVFHVPNKGEQMVRYYGHYSNVARGKRKKQDQDSTIPYILEPVESPSALRHINEVMSSRS